jgi:hypothetical protein
LDNRLQIPVGERFSAVLKVQAGSWSHSLSCPVAYGLSYLAYRSSYIALTTHSEVQVIVSGAEPPLRRMSSWHVAEFIIRLTVCIEYFLHGIKLKKFKQIIVK